MAKRILEHGDYEGVLPEGWDVIELPSGKKVVDEKEVQHMVNLMPKLKASTAVIKQCSQLFKMVNEIDPGIFGKESINWGGLIVKLKTAPNLAPEFAKLDTLVKEYSTKYPNEI